MKRILLIALVALGFVTTTNVLSARAQGKFEGTITWAMTMPQMDEDKHDMIANMKGDQSLMEMDLGAQGGIKMWSDRAAKKMYMYMAAMGSNGFIMDIPSDSVAMAKAGDEQLEIKPTGKKAMIAGHNAEEYQMKLKEGEMSMWMASDFPKNIMEAFHSMSNTQKQDVKVTRALKELMDKGQVPVKMQMSSAGEIAMTMELVKVEPKKLDDKIFERPSSITFKPMPAGMMNMH
jgi:hypothetical protein